MITGWKHEDPKVQFEFERLYKLMDKKQAEAAIEMPRSRSTKVNNPPEVREKVRRRDMGLIELDNVITEAVMSDYGAMQYETIILPFVLDRPGQYHMVLIVANPNNVYERYEVLRFPELKDGDHEGNSAANKITVYARNCGHPPSLTTLARDLTARDENPRFYYMVAEAWNDEVFPTCSVRTWQSVHEQYINYMMQQ